MRILVSDKAKIDLLRIYSYLAERNSTAAEAVLLRIDEKFRQLADLPFIGRERSSLGSGIRSVVVGNHLVFYTVGEDAVMIVRVIHGRMDIDAEFRR
jgi:toxin ParE1/3/4